MENVGGEGHAKRVARPTFDAGPVILLLWLFLFRDFSPRSRAIGKGFAEAIKREHRGVTECAFSAGVAQRSVDIGHFWRAHAREMRIGFDGFDAP